MYTYIVNIENVIYVIFNAQNILITYFTYPINHDFHIVVRCYWNKKKSHSTF